MSEEKKQEQSPKKLEGGYQPLKEGYQASGHKKPLLRLPQGASGESSNTTSTSANNSTSPEQNNKNDSN